MSGGGTRKKLPLSPARLPDRRTLHAIAAPSQRSWSLAGNFAKFASMETEEPVTPATQEDLEEIRCETEGPVTPATREDLEEIRRELRKKILVKDLQDLDARHQEERQVLSQGLRELAVGRTNVRDRLWADWIRSPFPDLGPGRHNLTLEQQQKLSAELPRADRCVHVVKHHLVGVKEQALDSRFATLVELGEEAASKLKDPKKLSREENRRSSQQEDGAYAAAAALNGEEPGEGDGKIPYWAENVLKESQQRDKEKQALLKEFLPAKNEQHVEVQRLLEVLDEKELRKAYEHRTVEEDWRVIGKTHQPVRRAGLFRFTYKKNPDELDKTASKEVVDYVDKNLGYPKLPGCYEEIKKLLDIEQNPIFSATLKEWNRKEDLFSRRVERKKLRVASLKNEVYQLIGFFSVFQGVVLTAVSQSSFLFCHNKWSPIALSVLASVISTLAVIQKLKQINDLQTNIDSEERDIKTAVRVGQRLRDPGSKGIDFVQLNEDIDNSNNRKLELSKKKHLAWLYFALVILTLVAFGVLFPISFWSILCKPGSPPSSPAPPAPPA